MLYILDKLHTIWDKLRNMKWYYKVLLLFACIFLFWIGSIIHASILTHLRKEALLQTVSTDFHNECSWIDDEPQIRILSITPKRAVVYVFGEMVGEKIVLTKQDGTWEIDEVVAAWSDWGGTADDYFIWPYWKNCVP